MFVCYTHRISETVITYNPKPLFAASPFTKQKPEDK